MATDLFSEIDPISALSVIVGIILWVIYLKYYKKLNNTQIKFIALLYFVLAVLTLLFSFIFPSLANLMITAIVFMVLAFLTFRKRIKDHSNYNAPVLHTKEEDIEREMELKSKYEEDIQFGKYYYKNKNYKKARDYLVHALKVQETAVDPWYYIGLINIDLNRYEEAIICFKRILDMDTSHEMAKTKLAYVKSLNESKKQNKK